MDRKTTLVSAVIAFGAAALASHMIFRGAEPKSSPVASRPTAVAAGPSYASLLADVDERVASLQKRATSRPTDWLIRMYLGNVLFERAGLTNQLDDFARVQAVLDEAFALVPVGAGPTVLAARFNFSIHRLEAAEKYLDMVDRRAIPQVEDQQIARALRAEIALQRGEYKVAFDGLSEVAAVVPALAKAELALYHAKTGDRVKAEAILEETLASTRADDPRRRAWIRLQLGVIAMDHGELLLALQRLQDADAELSGWWLVQENIAEVHDRRDDHDKAIAIHEELVRTVDLPQHMDALAGLYRHTGAPQKADELIARAAARWEQQLARFPEAAMGHALQHYMQFGPPERALELALANEKLRPGGEAQVSLARVYLQQGRPAEALEVATRALATPYRSARLHDVAAKAHAALGHTAAAEEQTALCYAINPMYSSDEHSH